MVNLMSTLWQMRHGLLLCEDCLGRKIGEKSDDSSAIDKLVKGKVVQKASGKCALCSKEAKYKIEYNVMMKAFAAASKVQ
jgi:hypothetical protein